MSITQNQTGIKTSYGAIWMSNAYTGATFTITTSYTELKSLATAFAIFTPSNDFSMSTDGRLAYTGTNTRKFLASASIANSLGFNSQAIAIAKNGTNITGAQSYADSGTLILNDIEVSLATNDYLSIFIKKITSSSTPSFYQINLTAEQVY